jgi:hypothetical protein
VWGNKQGEEVLLLVWGISKEECCWFSMAGSRLWFVLWFVFWLAAVQREGEGESIWLILGADKSVSLTIIDRDMMSPAELEA